MARIDLVECNKCDCDRAGPTATGTCPKRGQPYHTSTGQGVFRSGDVQLRTDRRLCHLRTRQVGLNASMVSITTKVVDGFGRNSGPVLISGELAAPMLVNGTTTGHLNKRA